MIEVTEISIEYFEDRMFNKYLKLFPSNERRQWSAIEKSYNDGIEHFYKIVLDNKDIGFIMLEKINNYPYYMDYFAIYKEYQNRGYGSKAIKYLLDNIVLDSGLIGEIEKVEDNKIHTKRRLEFYKRLGFNEVNSEYLLYKVSYTPIIYYKKRISKDVIDKIFFKYYLTNMGSVLLKKNCKVIK